MQGGKALAAFVNYDSGDAAVDKLYVGYEEEEEEGVVSPVL